MFLEGALGDRSLLHPLAIDWMCNIDQWEPEDSSNDTTQQVWLDRYAVTAFFYASNNDHPDTFDHYALDGSSAKSTCEWFRIECHGNTTGGSKIANLEFFGTCERARL